MPTMPTAHPTASTASATAKASQFPGACHGQAGASGGGANTVHIDATSSGANALAEGTNRGSTSIPLRRVTGVLAPAPGGAECYRGR
jgi:hypothetical protein